MFYPLKFEPILKEKIWGGKKLKTVLNKAAASDNTGESWELSGLPNNVSVVSEGKLKGLALNKLISEYKELLLGNSIYNRFGQSFPLLIKFIDASDDLSVQVHPDDETARKLYGQNGKNELWYILESDKDAELIIGLKKTITLESFKEAIKNHTLTDKLNSEKVKRGDIFYIPSGRIHAIKKGVMLTEIQQPSDITYRIYDWNRKGLDGNYRKLHTEAACKVADLKAKLSYKSEYKHVKNEFATCETNQNFTVNILHFNKEIRKNYSETDSFIVYICTKGAFRLLYPKKEIHMIFGETVLLPAVLKNIILIPETESELLEVYIEVKN
ncbi:MAG: mannose-6-phosphate isomerase [Chlorobi bacterium]|nr:mannose-6-phosphate isomerase [Chlorobiota bacterium]